MGSGLENAYIFRSQIERWKCDRRTALRRHSAVRKKVRAEQGYLWELIVEDFLLSPVKRFRKQVAAVSRPRHQDTDILRPPMLRHRYLHGTKLVSTRADENI
jgi:hypothetical protein